MNHNGKLEHDQLAEQARQALDQSIETLPDEISLRLQAARQQALAAAGSGSGSGGGEGKLWQRAGWGLAASVALAMLLWWQSPAPRAPEMDLAELVDAARLSDEELDVVQDLEFVYWLSQQDETAQDETTQALPANG